MSDDQHPLTATIAAACGEAATLVGRLGDDATRADTARLIRAELDRIHAGAATLVVAGEKKRGKSSLINALVGQADLLPVEVDVATSVHITVRQADEPGAQAYLEGIPEPQPIEVSKIAEYASVDPVTQQPRREDVLHVEVGVPSPLLAQGLALVDTPGVGGLVSGHAQITMAALDRADALVFVVNGSSELTRSELRFLEQATERIATVYFILTQTDKYDAWQQILERNRALIRERAARYQDCPWFAVSSRAKLDADAASLAGNAELAARRLADSGFAELTSALSNGAARSGEEIRLRNALHVARVAVEPLAALFERRLRSLAQDELLAEEVHAREVALSRLQQQDAAWHTILSARLQELEGAAKIGFQRSVNDLRALAEEKINTAGQEGLSELAGDLEAGIRGAWMQLENAIRDGIGRISAELSREFDTAGLAEVAAELELPDRIRQLPAPVAQADDGAGLRGGLERLAVSSGSGMVAFSVLTMLTGGAAMPVLAGLGVTVGLMGRRRRREELLRRRGDAGRYLQRVMNELYTEGPPRIHEGMVGIGQQIAVSIADRLGQERVRLEAELAEYYRNLQAAEEERQQQRERIGADARALRTAAGQLAELQGRLTTA